MYVTWAQPIFRPYDAAELRMILEHHADRAFVDEACDTSAIAKVAALAAQDMGNARQALDLLRLAGVSETAKRETPCRTRELCHHRATKSPA